MNALIISWSYIKGRPLTTLLNTLLLALGVSIIVVLVLLNAQLKSNLESNARGIDLVVGAKGSPLQLILSSIYHIDYPTGNIPLSDARSIAENKRFVRNAVPLALGDSYRDFRIVGTSYGYPELYGGELASGTLWEGEAEVTIGSNVAAALQLQPGSEFSGEHGLVSGGQKHEAHPYKVAGVLKPSNSVLDNLILTSVETVWLMHEKEEDHEAGHDHETTPDIFGIHTEEDITGKELTAILIQYRGPRAAIQFPRMVNSRGALQSASPPFETARLFSLVGVGVDVVRTFAYVIIFMAVLSLFVALYSSLKERKYDLAIIRSLGASPARLFMLVLIEGTIITVIGCFLGLILGHGVVEIAGMLMATSNQALVSGLVILPEESWILIISIILGIFASMIPAIEAYKTDISQVLAKA